jgi:hypothetical protein
MTIAKPTRPRTDVRTGHTFAVPVVRELPRPAAGLTGGGVW